MPRSAAITHSVTPEALGSSAWVSSTVYESTGFRFPEAQQISTASSQLLISLLFIIGGEGAKGRREGGTVIPFTSSQPVQSVDKITATFPPKEAQCNAKTHQVQ